MTPTGATEWHVEVGTAAHETTYRDAVQAFAEVAHAIRDEVELDPLLQLLARKICTLLEIGRCSVYLKDDRSSLYRGRVSEGPGNVIRAREIVKRLTCGGDGDRFSKEILSTKRPVLVANAKSDPRPNRTIMSEWNVHAMLGVPMIFGQEVSGLMFLDNEAVPHEYTPEEQDIAATFANLAAIAVAHARITENLRSNLKTIEHQNELLRLSEHIESKLTELVLRGADLMEIANAASALTGKPVSIHDAQHRRLATATPAPQIPAPRLFEPESLKLSSVIDAVATLGTPSLSVIGPFRSQGLTHRFLLAPIIVRDEQWGYVVLAEYPSKLRQTDRIVAQRTATIVALELSVEQRERAARLQARDALTRDLIFAVDDEGSLARRARFQGMEIGEPYVVCFVSDVEGVPTRMPPPSVYAGVLPPGAELFVTSVGDGQVALIQLSTQGPAREAVQEVGDQLGGLLADADCADSVVAAISSVCRDVSQFAPAYTEARQLLRCLKTFNHERAPRVLSADDLGPARLLLSATSRSEADRFATDTIGPLLDNDDASRAELLRTLAVFFDSSRSICHSATRLGVHENTIRYRLRRIHELTGRDVVKAADDQLACQLALLVLRLEGRLPSSFRTSR